MADTPAGDFAAVTGQREAVAAHYLGLANGCVQTAVTLFFAADHQDQALQPSSSAVQLVQDPSFLSPHGPAPAAAGDGGAATCAARFWEVAGHEVVVVGGLDQPSARLSLCRSTPLSL